MPDDSAGNASRPPSPIPVTGQGADAPQVNVPIDDIYACLNRRHFSDGRKPFSGNQNFNGYKASGAANATDAQDYVTLSQMQALVASISGALTGELKVMTGTAIPAGYLSANGQSVLRTTYPTLWTFAQASGNLAATQGEKTPGQYGPGDGSTTFTVPELTADGGQFVRPLSSGRTMGSSQADVFRSHAHTGTIAPNGAHDHSAPVQGSQSGPAGGFSERYTLPGATGPAGLHIHGLTIDFTGGTETRPKNIAYPFIIKT